MELVKPVKTVTVKAVELGNEELRNTLSRIAAQPVSNKTSCKIHRNVQQITKAINQVLEGYKKEIMDVFAKRDAEGKIMPSPDGNPNSFAFEESKEAEFIKAQEEYGKKEIQIPIAPFVPDDFRDIRLAARDLYVLGNMYLDTEANC